MPILQPGWQDAFLTPSPSANTLRPEKSPGTERRQVATELGGTQISSLMEVLPGIAQVLRSPVADAIVNLIRAACRVREFDIADADEMLKFAVRRNLMAQEESERVLAEARAIVQRRADRALERDKPRKPAAKPKAKARVKPMKKAKVKQHPKAGKKKR